jgi:hypothetical protein
MQPPNSTPGLGLVTHEPTIAAQALINPGIRGPSIEELDSIELPDYGLAKGQLGPPMTSTEDTSILHQATPVTDSQTTPSDLGASPPQSPTFEGDTATSSFPASGTRQ